MNEEIKLEWQYQPTDFFEEALSFQIEQAAIVINEGYVTATLPAAAYDQDERIRDRIIHQIDYRFRAAQLVNHRPYRLLGLRLARTDAQGIAHQDVLFSAVISAVTVTSRADLQLTDPDGNIVADTKTKRLERTRAIGDLTATHAPRDSTLRGMLASYGAATEDRDHELIHLYEIPDALRKRFGGEASAQQALGIRRSRWRALGRLANREPLRQGRHRGQFDANQLRDATAQELETARAIASQMIEAYLAFLEGSAPRAAVSS